MERRACSIQVHSTQEPSYDGTELCWDVLPIINSHNQTRRIDGLDLESSKLNSTSEWEGQIGGPDLSLSPCITTKSGEESGPLGAFASGVARRACVLIRLCLGSHPHENPCK